MVHPLDSYVVPSLNMNISVLHRNLKILMKMCLSINSKITSLVVLDKNQVNFDRPFNKLHNQMDVMMLVSFKY